MVSQKEPNEYDKQLVSLGRTLQILREEENTDVLIDTVLGFLSTEFGYSLIWIGLYDRIEHRLLGKGGITTEGHLPLLRQRFMLSPGDVLEQVVIQQRPLAIPDLSEELRAGEWRKAAQALNVKGTVIFPIRYRDACYGVVLLGTPHWGVSPRSDEKARLSMVFGSLGTALYQIESEWKRQQEKRPDQPLLTLLTKMRELSGLGARLEAVVEETHHFIQPSRTSVYWFERERRYFWRRVSNRQRTAGFNEANQPASGITVQEVGGFYQALLADQIVSIGEAHSSLKADLTSRLMQQIRARSLLAAPILVQGELWGFLAVEGNDPRIWEEEEKSYIRGAAQIIALTAPLHEMEQTISEVKADQQLTAGIAHSITTEEDWKNTLKMAAEQVCHRLRAERFLLLVFNRELAQFELAYQTQPHNRRPLLGAIGRLPDPIWKELENSPVPLTFENLDSDQRLEEWRQTLMELGVKAALVGSTRNSSPLEGIVIVCHETPRTWNRAECSLVQMVNQQIGVILHQWSLQQENEQQQKINQTIQWGLTIIQQAHQLEDLEKSALQYLTQLLQVPLVGLISWQPGDSTARIKTATPGGDNFSVTPNGAISVQTDPLVRWALESEEILAIAGVDIPPQTRRWLSGTGIGQVLIAALRTAPEHEPTSILLIADVPSRYWSDTQLKTVRFLVNQLAWSRRYVSLTERLASERKKLEQLNWYKHRRLEDVYRALMISMKRLNELEQPKDPLHHTRQQQIFRQLNEAIAPIQRLLQEEQWQLQTQTQTISLISLLKKAIERVDWLIRQRQLWSQVHDETNLTISGDISKIELVLYELLLFACQRSSAGGRIDLWCRQIDNRWFELSITDSGQVNHRLLADLERGRTKDLLYQSTLEHPPGLHIAVCQALMQLIGGELTVYLLDDNRTVSRLVLPLAHGAK